MPQVIAVLNQKGGSGKTTLATNLAHSLLLDGYRVLLADADPQGSLRDWQEASHAELLPVVGMDRDTLAKDLPAVSSGFDFVVIDGPPQIAKLSAAAVKVADFVLIPVQPSPYDIWACADLVDLVQARQQVTGGSPHAAFVISRAIKQTKLTADISPVLEQYGLPVLSSGTTQRVIYPTSAAEGQTVLSVEPNGPAAAEINAIKQEMKEILNGTIRQSNAPRIAI